MKIWNRLSLLCVSVVLFGCTALIGCGSGGTTPTEADGPKIELGTPDSEDDTEEDSTESAATDAATTTESSATDSSATDSTTTSEASKKSATASSGKAKPSKLFKMAGKVLWNNTAKTVDDATGGALGGSDTPSSNPDVNFPQK